MRRLVLEPRGWPCALEDCPPGLFVATGGDNSVGVKVIGHDSVLPAVGADEDVFAAPEWGPWPRTLADDLEHPRMLVQPVVARWSEEG